MSTFFLFAGGLSFVVALCCLVFTCACYKQTAGMVVAAESVSGEADSEMRLTVRFRTDLGDREFKPFYQFTDGQYKPGDSIQIKYNPHGYIFCQINRFTSRWLGMLMFIFCGLVFTWAAFQ